MSSNKIILHLQMPFCDYRRITRKSSDYLPQPNWQNPIEYSQFIKYFGVMEKRKNSAPQIFLDENFYIRGKGGIKFIELEKCKLEKVRCLYKKLWNDAFCGTRYEVGLEFYGIGKRNPTIEKGQAYDLHEAIDEILGNIIVKFKYLDRVNERQYSLIDSPKPLIQLYKKATSIDNLEEDNNKFKYGNICLLFEIDSLNSNCNSIPHEDKTVLDEDIFLYIKRYKYKGREVAIFTLKGDFKYNAKKLREYRVIILRMYFEYQNLRLLLNYIQNPKNEISHDVFDKYINKKIKYFNKRKSGECEKYKILLSVQSVFELIAPGEIENLSKNFNSIRLQIKSNLLKLVRDSHLEHKLGLATGVLKNINEELRIGKLDKAINLLSNILEPEKVTMIKLRYRRLIENEALGLINRNDYDVGRNRITNSILKLIDNTNIN